MIAFNSQLQKGCTTFPVEYLRPHSRKIYAALESELDALKQRIHTQNRRRTDSEHLPGEISGKLDAVEEKVARVSELCAEINN